jgi:diguanylate cyclase (GGDEF)-like protein/PAS domain S-box-containing protein
MKTMMSFYGRHKKGIWFLALYCVLILCLRLFFSRFFSHEEVYNFLVLPVVLGAWYGGVEVGVASMALNIFAANVIFFQQDLDYYGTSHHIFDSVSYLLQTGFVIFLISVLQRSRHEAITERELSEIHLNKLVASTQRLRRFVESDIIGVIFFNLKGDIIDANNAFLNMLGYTRQELRSGELNWSKITHSHASEGEIRVVRDLQEKGVITPYEQIFLHKNNTPIHTILGGARFDANDDEGVAFVLDNRERKSFEQKVHHQAFHDSLTDLPNRTLLFQRLEHIIAESKKHQKECAVLFLDLDKFKHVNDGFGHQIGDSLLVSIARRLQSAVKSDDIVSRYGGDEFVIALSSIRGKKATDQAVDRILKVFHDAFIIDKKQVFINTSIGVSRYPQDGDTPEQLIQNADQALYFAKEHGRGRVASFHEIKRWQQSPVITASEMRRALHAGQFCLFYQPLFAGDTLECTGAEALIRWNHPERGLLSPGQFVSLLEENGMFKQLNDWVLDTACEDIGKWCRLIKRPFSVSVNIPPAQFYDSTFADEVISRVQKNRISNGRLVLEITETMALQHVNLAQPAIQALHNAHIGVALDDYGVGHSSLHLLKELPIRKLKLDRTFIQTAYEDSTNAEIVRAMYSLTKNLNIEFVAEGVETEKQLQFLRTLPGPCELQGYYLEKPLPSQQLLEYLSGESQAAHSALSALHTLTAN